MAIHGCSAEDIILAGYMTNNESLREFLPPREEAVLFSQETIRSQDLPLGIHKVNIYKHNISIYIYLYINFTSWFYGK